jgi:hypothetical protein
MSWNEGFEGRIGVPRLKHELEYGSCGSDTNSNFLHFWQPQAAMQGPLSARSAFFVSLSPPRRNPEPDRLLRDSFRCEFRAAARVPPSFGPLTSVDLFGNSRLRVGGGICGRCRLCSRTGGIAFGSPHLAEFSGQLVAFSVLFFLWCTLYFSIKQWQQAAHAREQLARDRERLVQAACRCCRKADLPAPQVTADGIAFANAGLATRRPSNLARGCSRPRIRRCVPKLRGADRRES